MGFFRKVFGQKIPYTEIVRELVIDRTINDPANKQGYGGNREEVTRIVNRLSENDILGGSPEGLIFRIVELYKSQENTDMPTELKLMMGIERALLVGAAKRRERELGRRLSDSETDAFVEEGISKLPKPLTLESYIEYRVLSVNDPGISKPFVDKARARAIQFFNVKD